MPKGIATPKQKEAQKIKAALDKLKQDQESYHPWNEFKNDPRTE